MKSSVILLICNQLGATYFFGLFNFLSSNRCCNSGVDKKYDFTSFYFPRHNFKDDIRQKVEWSKHSLICGLKEVIKHENISAEIKLKIIYYFLDEIPDLKETNNIEFNAIKDSEITNEIFIKLDEKYSGFTRHLNLLSAIIQFGEIRNIININNLTTPFGSEYFNEIGNFVKKVLSNITKCSLYNTKLCVLDNAFIWFRDLIMMKENKNLHYSNVDLEKIEGYIGSIKKYYNDNNNIMELEMQTLVRLQNGLEFVHSALNLYHFIIGKASSQKLIYSGIENPNLIISKMIINTMIYFGVLPFSEKIYECVVTDKNIDFWNEYNMISYINISMFFYINIKSFSTVFPKYCDVIVKRLGDDTIRKSIIILAKSLIEYLRSNPNKVNNKIGNYFNSNMRIISLENAISIANLKFDKLKISTDIYLNALTSNTKNNIMADSVFDLVESTENSFYESVQGSKIGGCCVGESSKKISLSQGNESKTNNKINIINSVRTNPSFDSKEPDEKLRQNAKEDYNIMLDVVNKCGKETNTVLDLEERVESPMSVLIQYSYIDGNGTKEPNANTATNNGNNVEENHTLNSKSLMKND